jgi:hypothetical protein
MQKWEYRQMVAYEWEINNLEGILDLLGSDGWQLCVMVERSPTERSRGWPYWLLALKRPKGGDR